MRICPDCGLRKDDDDLNESQPGCRCDRDEEFVFDYEGILADGEAFLRAEKESRPIDANTALKRVATVSAVLTVGLSAGIKYHIAIQSARPHELDLHWILGTGYQA